MRAAGAISAWTLVSRALGFVRDGLMTHALGLGLVFDAFVIAWTLPNLLRRMFGEGALSAAFVPAYTRARKEHGEEGARSLLAGVTGGLASALLLLTLVVVGTALLLRIVLDDGDALLPDLVVWLFPYCIPVCLIAIYSGALQSHGRFGPPARAPVLLNLAWIAALVWAIAVETDKETTARGVAISLALAGVFQLVSVARPLSRLGQLPRPRWPRAGDGAAKVFRRTIPAALGMSAVQINLMVDQGLALTLLEEGANSALFLGNRLLQFPYALIAVPLGVAVFPDLARDASDDDLGRLRARHDDALRLSLWLMIPATAGVMLIAEPLIDVAFRHGEFSSDDVEVTAGVTALAVLSLPAVGATQLAIRGLYALGRTAIPARISALAAALNIALDLLFLQVYGFGVLGLVGATVVSAYANAIWSRRALAAIAPNQRPGAERRDLLALARILVATAGMSGAVLLVQHLFDDPESGSRLHRAWGGLVIPIATGGLCYGLIQMLFGGPEWRAVRAKLTRRGGTP